MAGQGVFTGALDVDVLGRLEHRLQHLALDRSAALGARLRTVLELHALMLSAGVDIGFAAHLALVEQTTDPAAELLVQQALLLRALPGGLEAVDCGLLTPELLPVVARRLWPLTDEVRLAVWQRLQARLLSAFDSDVLLTAPRLSELLAGWVIAADPEGAVERRRNARQAASVDYRRREDGLTDLFLNGMTGPDAQAVLTRIRDRARAFGADDLRPVGLRRLEAAVDLLLGRDRLPLDESQDPFVQESPVHCGPSCGCRLGEPVPCGIGVTLLLPLGAALGTTDEVAVLEGHGPLEPDLAQQILQTAPVIRPVWVDEHGVPVAVGDRTESPPRGDPQAVRAALERLAASCPPRLVPRHPNDHPDDDSRPSVQPDESVDDRRFRLTPSDPVGAEAFSPSAACDEPVLRVGWLDRGRRRPMLLEHAHPAGRPGTYRPSTRLARLVKARAPKCEWPGCGRWSSGCDLDHDTAHPDGPTCGCNLGPLCRRHHRIKQLLMTKTRRADGVHWTGPTGRHWLSPAQHQPPRSAVRPALVLADPRGPGDPRLDEDGDTDDDWLSGRADVLRAEDPFDAETVDPDEDPYDRLAADGWGLALDDHTRWTA